ncbi:alcohol dehydrogenase class IV [Rhodoligotrophos appendicifer]|uniref:iron-containing alcohol dehydrogenase n=1 Tax=Rhodoligotrophos appendicifer TaxID=987056 RepID=UPI001184D461|nr:iron-containing alcohol dehydrogenase [Rhodoligotrophos appendicifer]
MTLTANWNYPTTVRFGAGRISELGKACRDAGITKPLLGTDPGLARLPMVQAIIDNLKAEGLDVAVFSEVRPNPVEANVVAGVEAYRRGGHDGVIALGGGSGLDVAKTIAMMQGQTRPLWDFEDIGDWWTRANAEAIAPIVAVPTTAGTGSEVGRATVITNEATHEKKIIFHPKLLPRIVIADPELTVGLPPMLTAATGMDALAHNLEAYCAPGYHPMAAGIAVEGMRLCRLWLPVATAEGTNIEARANMLAASSMGATAFQRGLGAIHALSHPFGGLYDAHHGTLNGVLMPYVLVANRPKIEALIDSAASYLGLRDGFRGFLDWIVALRSEIGIPNTLAEMGIDDGKLDQVAEMAVRDPSAGSNPILFTQAEYRDIAERAIKGDLGL